MDESVSGIHILGKDILGSPPLVLKKIAGEPGKGGIRACPISSFLFPSYCLAFLASDAKNDKLGLSSL
jgi:hypothetical protein